MYFTLHLSLLLPKGKYACIDVQKNKFSKKYNFTAKHPKSSLIHKSQSKHKSQQEEQIVKCILLIFLKNNSVFHVPKTDEILK